MRETNKIELINHMENRILELEHDAAARRKTHRSTASINAELAHLKGQIDEYAKEASENYYNGTEKQKTMPEPKGVLHACKEEQQSKQLELVTLAIGRVFGIGSKPLNGRGRVAGVVIARQTAMYSLVMRFGWTLTLTGQVFGRNHATVSHAIKTVENRLETDWKFKEKHEKYNRKLTDQEALDSMRRIGSSNNNDTLATVTTVDILRDWQNALDKRSDSELIQGIDQLIKDKW